MVRGRGGLERSLYCNDYKVAVYGRSEAIRHFECKLATDECLQERLWTLSGLRLVCHCSPAQDCHGDVITKALNYLSKLREEPTSDGDTSPDEGVPEKFSGWRGHGHPMEVGVGYTSRELCDDVIPSDWAPRVDAQASHGRVGVGGWCPVLNSASVPDTMLSRWFSLEKTKEHFPWVFSKSDKPSRVIATLEALATLLALKLFYGDKLDSNIRKIRLQPTWTDNRGNGSALNKLMSTRYPVNALLMELATHCKYTGI